MRRRSAHSRSLSRSTESVSDQAARPRRSRRTSGTRVPRPPRALPTRSNNHGPRRSPDRGRDIHARRAASQAAPVAPLPGRASASWLASAAAAPWAAPTLSQGVTNQGQSARNLVTNHRGDGRLCCVRFRFQCRRRRRFHRHAQLFRVARLTPEERRRARDPHRPHRPARRRPHRSGGRVVAVADSAPLHRGRPRRRHRDARDGAQWPGRARVRTDGARRVHHGSHAGRQLENRPHGRALLGRRDRRTRGRPKVSVAVVY